MTANEVLRWLVERLAQLNGTEARFIDPRENFTRYGLDSLGATRLVAELGSVLGRALSPTLVWECPTPEGLARRLGLDAAEGSGQPGPPARSIQLGREPIAVVGLACRFPMAPDTRAFWRLLCGSVDAITEVPSDRWDASALYDPDWDAAGRSSSRWGGFLEQVDRFDASFFHISPREAADMDPQQRLALELAWEALEDAGIPPASLRDTQTGVFLGAMWHDYATLSAGQLSTFTQYTSTGQHLSIIPGRLSYALGLRGPSIAINTACSSSLVAVHYARRSLQLAECSVALAGGINLMLSPENTVALSKLGALSPDGRSRAFDACANGFVRGEGGGVVVLKPLSQARADGNPVYCVLLGSAVNNDGFTNGLTAPSPQAQELVLRAAYVDAGVSPNAVHYVETHGTGTVLGDPIEAGALGAVLGPGRAAERPLLIGSVKTNIGHLETAAGIAGLIKTALAIEHREIPPSLHFRNPNPGIDFRSLGLKVPVVPTPWEEGYGPALAGVSSFGFSGTNCHVVLSAPPAPGALLLPLSAPTAEELQATARRLREVAADEHRRFHLDRVQAYLLSCPSERHRLALTVASRSELVEGLTAFLEERRRPGVASGEADEHVAAPVFVFGGQGSQWRRMGMGLCRIPAFRAALSRCEQVLLPHLRRSLQQVLLGDGEEWLDDASVVQPVLFAVQVAQAELLVALGIRPGAVVGQSLGETAAAYVAGCLSLQDAAQIVAVRSGAVRTLSGQGAMIVTDLPAAEARRLIADQKDRSTVAELSPSSTVISGESAHIAALSATLQQRGGYVARIRVDYAAHTPQVDPLLPGVCAALSAVRPYSGSVPLYSTVEGRRMDGSQLDASYWCRNERETFLLRDTLDRVSEDGFGVFLDVNPHPVLLRPIEQCLNHAQRDGLVLPLLRKEEEGIKTLLDSLGALWVRGHAVRWDRLFGTGTERIALPAELELPPLRPRPEAPAERPALLPLSARSPEALRALAGDWVSYLGADARHPFADIVYTASVRRQHLPHRLVAAGRSPEELRQQLQSFLSGESRTGLAVGTEPAGGRRKLAFVFPGQGGQWFAMGRRLLSSEPVFRQAIEACHDAMRRYASFSLLDILRGEGPDAGMERVDCVQPAVFAMQIGLTALFRSWGVTPAAVVGHSMGEVAAAHTAGWLTLDEACRVICRRSQLVSRTSGQGGMALVELPIERAQELLREHQGELVIAAINGPRTLVLAGAQGALADLLARLEREGVFCRTIKVDYASHSPQMDPLQPELLGALAPVRGATGNIPLYSTVTGRCLDRPPAAEYWAANLREPVRFWEAVQALAREGFDTFVEINAHPTLLPGISDGLGSAAKDLAVIPAMRREEGELGGPLAALGALYADGYPVDWELQSPHGGRVVPLPAYPFQRQRYWIATPSQQESVARPSGGHPLLGLPIQLSTEPGTRLFETLIEANGAAHVKDHRVQDAVVFPAAAYVEMALAAGKEHFGNEDLSVDDLRLNEALIVEPSIPRKIQTVTRTGGAGEILIQIASQESDGAPWRLHSSARVRTIQAGAAGAPSSLSAVRTRCRTDYAADAFYEALSEIGLIYGPAFRAVTQIARGPGEALGRLQLPAELQAEAGTYLLHPSLLDGGLQLLVAAVRSDGAESPWLPVRIESVRFHRRPGSGSLGHSVVREARDGWTRGDVQLLDEQGVLLAELIGVELERLEARGARAAHYWLHEWRPAAERSPELVPGGRILLLADRAGLAEELARWLKGRGADVTLRTATAQDPVPELSLASPAYSSIVYLGSTGPSSGDTLSLDVLSEEQRRDSAAVLRLVQALAKAGLRDTPRLWLVTRGVHAPDADSGILSPAAGILWGLGRTVSQEHPELRCTRIDLAPRPWIGEVAALGSELLAAEVEEEVALREGGRFVARLVQRSVELFAAVTPEPVAGRPFRLITEKPGVLEHLTLRLIQRRAPLAGEVEVAVRTASLNFLDVLLAMGTCPGMDSAVVPMGLECAGIVVSVGEGVTEPKVGEEVVALTFGAFSTHVTVPVWRVARIPADLSMEQAAAAPLVLMTAYYGLHTLARLKKGERVLIHSAAGGTGLAAVQLAQRIGAEIFATAGSEEKRAYLRSLGIEHVMDSRSLGFADEILRRTQGRGVDVVLNSLTGAAIEKSFTALAPYGRFVELGKRDIYENAPLDLGHFRKKLSYFAVDLAGMLKERPAEMSELLHEVVRGLGAGTLTPPPVRVFPISQAQDAFRLMARGGHIGKLVLSLSDPAAEVAVQRGAVALREDGTYLITGGLGGLGLSLAGWMVDKGARHLVLLGRKGAESQEQQSAVIALKGTGAEVVIAQADVSRRSDMEAVLQQIRERMPPLRGVVHAAGILDDGLLAQQDAERFAKVFAPKIAGAWNLHELTRKERLDFFVLYSSASALLGLPGQGSYAAANAFLDALAHYRRASRLPALSINWGAFSEVGLAAAQANRGQRLAERGMKSLTPQRGNEEFGRLLGTSEPQVGVMDLDLRQWVEYYPQAAASSLLSVLVAEAKKSRGAARGDTGLLQALHTADSEQRSVLLRKYVREQLGHVLRMQPSQIDDATPFKSLGLDSLLGLELRNLLESGLGLKLSATLSWTYPNVSRLAAYLGGLLGEPEPRARGAEPPEPAAAPQGISRAELDSLSDSELAKLGSELLD